MLLSAASRRRASVVLPAPDGDEMMKSKPRRAMWGSAAAMLTVFFGVSTDILFDVLNLFAKLIDNRLELETKPRDVDGIRLRT